MEIFDKDGNVLDITNIIYGFIKDRAEKNNKDIEDVYVGVEIGFPRGSISIHTVECVENGYDAVVLNNFGDSIKLN